MVGGQWALSAGHISGRLRSDEGPNNEAIGVLSDTSLAGKQTSRLR